MYGRIAVCGTRLTRPRARIRSGMREGRRRGEDDRQIGRTQCDSALKIKRTPNTKHHGAASLASLQPEVQLGRDSKESYGKSNRGYPLHANLNRDKKQYDILCTEVVSLLRNRKIEKLKKKVFPFSPLTCRLLCVVV